MTIRWRPYVTRTLEIEGQIQRASSWYLVDFETEDEVIAFVEKQKEKTPGRITCEDLGWEIDYCAIPSQITQDTDQE